ncbi:YeiH family protein [Paracoccus sp. Z118]|uniref:YeiH family protein n=1 Tax=Paracoccus sp. Z118 TaxID=2851017 RepID=UPI001C2BCA82|nr:YeiH family protein [Paracoccus sp. Z118]MBV0892954.1 YeiH family protein [Paracoccus sp. Z118]
MTAAEVTRAPGRALDRARELFPGLVSAVTVALAAKFISEHYGAPVMLMALLLGMAFTFLAEPGTTTAQGVEFASKKVLRFGVALLGLGITVQQIAAAGLPVVGITLGGVALTIGAGIGLARVFGRTLPFGLLTGGAVAICGASAALAISSVLPKDDPSRERDTVFTVIAVTALSTIAMIVYPMIGAALGLSDQAMGVFFGATIHDVAQVVGAGYSVSDEAGATATFVKLLRVALLVPVVVTLSLYFARHPGASQGGKLPIPFFVLGFAALVLIGSTDLIPAAVTATLLDLSRWCLITAIAALGMKTSLRKLAEVGPRAIAMVCGLTALLAGFALAAILLLHI